MMETAAGVITSLCLMFGRKFGKKSPNFLWTDLSGIDGLFLRHSHQIRGTATFPDEFSTSGGIFNSTCFK